MASSFVNGVKILLSPLVAPIYQSLGCGTVTKILPIYFSKQTWLDWTRLQDWAAVISLAHQPTLPFAYLFMVLSDE